MAIARRVGGFSPAQADDLRKAISKKNKKLMATLKEPLMEGLRANGLPQNVCNKLWSNFEATGDYSFNKSHAACYALISYRTAFLKANYPVEYMAALVSSVMNTKDKVPFYVNQCHEMGIEVLPPDVNESEVGFTVVGRQDPLRPERGQGRGGGRHRVDHRGARRRPFASIYDFCARVDSALVNRRTLEALIKSGAFDSTGDTRRGMLEALPAAVASGERRRRDRAQGQGGLFDVLAGDGGGDGGDANDHPPTGAEEFDADILLRFEKEALGLYVSSHPLAGHARPAPRPDRRHGEPARRPARRPDGLDGRGHLGPHPPPDAQRRRPWRCFAWTTSTAASRRSPSAASASSSRIFWSKTRSSWCAAASTARAKTTSS